MAALISSGEGEGEGRKREDMDKEEALEITGDYANMLENFTVNKHAVDGNPI